MSDHNEYLETDLELSILSDAMAQGNNYIKDVVSKLLITSLPDMEALSLRQELLCDCMEHEAKARELYQLICDLIALDKDAIFNVSKKKAKYMLGLSSDVLLSMIPNLKNLYKLTQELKSICHSRRMLDICNYVEDKWSPNQLSAMTSYLNKIKNTENFQVITNPGSHMRPEAYTLTEVSTLKTSLFGRFVKGGKNVKGFDVNETDEDASLALTALKNAALHDTSALVVAVKNQLVAYLKDIRERLGFCVGCLNLKNILEEYGIPICMPVFSEKENILHFKELSNVTLSLQQKKATVRNSISCDGYSMITVTGSNQGGKTTWMRGLGQAILMAKTGMFVAAEEFEFTSGRVFTHFIREEDQDLKSGKLDEELVRMSKLISHILPGDILLMNESFSSTNEEEGSGIAKEIISALLKRNIRVIYITHFYRFIQLIKEHSRENPEVSLLHLNAFRTDDGVRTFELIIKEPTVHGHGEDLYHEIFS